jgi:hypothetical protein
MEVGENKAQLAQEITTRTATDPSATVPRPVRSSTQALQSSQAAILRRFHAIQPAHHSTGQQQHIIKQLVGLRRGLQQRHQHRALQSAKSGGRVDAR